MLMDREAFKQAYKEAALWTSTDGDDKPLDERYDVYDIPDNILAEMDADCDAFMDENKNILDFAVREYGYRAEEAGHDFWLTRNRHGAGHWDRGMGWCGEELTKAAHAYGSYYLILD